MPSSHMTHSTQQGAALAGVGGGRWGGCCSYIPVASMRDDVRQEQYLVSSRSLRIHVSGSHVLPFPFYQLHHWEVWFFFPPTVLSTGGCVGWKEIMHVWPKACGSSQIKTSLKSPSESRRLVQRHISPINNYSAFLSPRGGVRPRLLSDTRLFCRKVRKTNLQIPQKEKKKCVCASMKHESVQ